MSELIIKTCYAIPCGIPFNMKPVRMNVKNKETVWIIEDGTSKQIEEYNEEEEDSDENFETKVVYNNHEIECNSEEDEGTPFDEQIISVSEQIRDSCQRITGKYVQNLVFTFGIDSNESKLYLLRNAVLEMSSDCYEENLFGDKEKAEEFNDFLIDQICSSPPKDKCVTNGKKCRDPIYKTKLIDVILFKSVKKYPKINKKLLYKYIKAKMMKISPEVVQQRVKCCLPCLLKYSSIHKEYQSAKETTGKDFIRASKEFEAFMPREVSERGKRSVGTTKSMHRPYSYSLNLKHSPYRSAPIPLVPVAERTPLTPIRKLRDAKNEESKRLSEGGVRLPTSRHIPRDKLFFHESVEIPPPKKLPKTYSERLAPKAYKSLPFNRDYWNNQSVIRKHKR